MVVARAMGQLVVEVMAAAEVKGAVATWGAVRVAAAVEAAAAEVVAEAGWLEVVAPVVEAMVRVGAVWEVEGELAQGMGMVVAAVAAAVASQVEASAVRAVRVARVARVGTDPVAAEHVERILASEVVRAARTATAN